MRCNIRIQIRKNDDYRLLHERAESASFKRTGIDTATGKEVHLPNGEYVTEAYSGPRVVMLWAIRIAMGVDPFAEITVSGGDEFLTFGCREVQKQPSLGELISSLSKATTPMPVPDLHDFMVQNNQGKGSALGMVPFGGAPGTQSRLWQSMFDTPLSMTPNISFWDQSTTGSR
jgi:hypothetical protein